MKRGIMISALALALLAGCASTKPAKLEVTDMTWPVTWSAQGTLSLDLPPAFAEDKKIPPRAEGKLDLTFESRVIQPKPKRSHFEGKLTLVITDPDKTRKYVDFAATLSGDYDGPPNEGLPHAASEASEVLKLFIQGLQEHKEEPKGKP